jgi:pfkB family carbohydrate kinase
MDSMAPETSAVDTTGAGDVFAAVFIGACLNGASQRVALRVATRLASKSVTAWGRAAYPTNDEFGVALKEERAMHGVAALFRQEMSKRLVGPDTASSGVGGSYLRRRAERAFNAWEAQPYGSSHSAVFFDLLEIPVARAATSSATVWVRRPTVEWSRTASSRVSWHPCAPRFS